MDLLLWILAVILVISGIVAIVRGQILWGIVLIIVGLSSDPVACRSSVTTTTLVRRPPHRRLRR